MCGNHMVKGGSMYKEVMGERGQQRQVPGVCPLGLVGGVAIHDFLNVFRGDVCRAGGSEVWKRGAAPAQSMILASGGAQTFVHRATCS